MIPITSEVILPAADALPLPAPAVLLTVLHQVTFFLHLLAMNAMLGGIILTLWARCRSRAPGDDQERLANAIAGTTPSLVATTVTLGVAPLLFLQTLMGQFFFTSSILMGWGWFSVVVVLIFAYYGTYLQSFKGEQLGSARTPLLMLTVALFLWVAFMFSNNTSLMAAVATWPGRYFADARGLHLNLDDATLVPRYVHALLGAVAVAGLMLATWGNRVLARDLPSGSMMYRTGVSALTWMTVINVLFGLWYLVALPRNAMLAFMGRNMTATGLLTVGFAATIILVIWGLKARKGKPGDSLVWPMVLTGFIMAVMVVMRSMARDAILGSLYQPSSFAVKTQTLNLVLFLVLLAGGVVVLTWMIRKLQQAWH